MTKPFAKSRIVYHHTKTSLVRGPVSPQAKLAARLADEEEPRLGVLVSRWSRIVFMEEELHVTMLRIKEHYEFVARELQQPLTMGFCRATVNEVGQFDTD